MRARIGINPVGHVGTRVPVGVGLRIFERPVERDRDRPVLVEVFAANGHQPCGHRVLHCDPHPGPERAGVLFGAAEGARTTQGTEELIVDPLLASVRLQETVRIIGALAVEVEPVRNISRHSVQLGINHRSGMRVGIDRDAINASAIVHEFTENAIIVLREPAPDNVLRFLRRLTKSNEVLFVLGTDVGVYAAGAITFGIADGLVEPAHNVGPRFKRRHRGDYPYRQQPRERRAE